jgi:hypothetical protein
MPASHVLLLFLAATPGLLFLALHLRGVSRMYMEYGAWQAVGFFCVPLYSPIFILSIDKYKKAVFTHWIWKVYSAIYVLAMGFSFLGRAMIDSRMWLSG